MKGKRYYWFRFKEDFFQDKRIKRLRQIAGGDTYTIIYLKMQLKALRTDGYIYFDNVLDDFVEELALDIDESPDNVRFTIEYLLRVGLLEISSDGKTYYMTELETLIGSEGASAQRVRDYRLRKKEENEALQCNTDVTKLLQCNTDVTESLQCNTDVTDVKRMCSAEIEIERREKNINISKDILSDNELSDEEQEPQEHTSKQFEHIKNEWNSLEAYGITPIRAITANSKRAKFVRARLKQYGEQAFDEAIEQIKESDFLQGKHNGRSWQITFDWFILPSNFVKVLEGNYKSYNEPQQEQPQPQRSTRVRNFVDIESSYSPEDIKELEKQLVEN